jgi:Permease for cytosine/purines, uracil, thiamine, allantoin
MDRMDPATEVEKAGQSGPPSTDMVDQQQHHGGIISSLDSRVKAVEQSLVKYNLEIRGIKRVEEHEKVQISLLAYLHAFGLWVSVNLAPNNITLGMLGPAVYELSFRDASLCAVFGAIIGSVPVAWVATWGPLSGLRAMVGQVASDDAAVLH